jgi:DNA polymerase III epsilon subunit family exonuclease
MAMSWASSYVVIDTETTGFGPNARILEIAAVTFENGVPVHEYSQLLCPKDVNWNDEGVQKALEVNHITHDQLLGKPVFEDILPDLALELSHTVWVAHNLSFDFEQVQQEFARAGRLLEPPQLAICTCRLAAYLSPTVKGNKLAQCAARYNVNQEDAHRAAVDARVCGHILLAMRQQGRLPEDDAAMLELVTRADRAWKGRR